MDSLIISLHGNVNNSKIFFLNSPESRPCTPPLNFQGADSKAQQTRIVMKKRILAKKMHNGKNAFEVSLYLYKQCKHHTKICVVCIEMDSFWKYVI